MTAFDLFLLGLALCLVVMAQTWKLARRLDNYSIVDLIWSYLFSVVALVYFWFAPGWVPRKLLILACVLLWSLRLGTHLFIRIKSHHPKEDSRYQKLRRDYGERVGFRMFLFFQIQGLSVGLLSLPFLYIMMNSSTGFHPLEIIAGALFVLAWIGEVISDRQLKAFIQEPANRGQICNVGLWHYSRHPNYFFESVIWWSFFLLAMSSPNGVWGIFSPLAMTYLLLYGTGVPMAEAQSLRSKGDLYRRYQATTSKFVPWPPRKI